MLLQNPQLAYALLQAQIVMKIVDPKVAVVSEFERNSSSCNVLCFLQITLFKQFKQCM